MILIDTSDFLALLQPRDSLHERAKAWARAIREPVVVTEYVLWETVNALSAPVDRPKVGSMLSLVRNDPTAIWLPASSDLLDAGLELHVQRPDKAWSLTDCISFVVMQRRGIARALTHDHHFEQAGFEALLRYDPPT